VIQSRERPAIVAGVSSGTSIVRLLFLNGGDCAVALFLATLS